MLLHYGICILASHSLPYICYKYFVKDPFPIFKMSCPFTLLKKIEKGQPKTQVSPSKRPSAVFLMSPPSLSA